MNDTPTEPKKSRLGHPCKVCGRDYHHCFSCGVELWYFDYCSEKCMHADGRKQCPSCRGWGESDDDDGDGVCQSCHYTGYVYDNE